jgi:hypothetical protein
LHVGAAYGIRTSSEQEGDSETSGEGGPARRSSHGEAISNQIGSEGACGNVEGRRSVVWSAVAASGVGDLQTDRDGWATVIGSGQIRSEQIRHMK